jgi:hypothetical protein
MSPSSPGTDAAPQGEASGAHSPLVLQISWGQMQVDSAGAGRDFKLFPGGGREWDWHETGTHHRPGIQISDITELLDHGSDIIVLSRGMELQLYTCADVFEHLQQLNVDVHVAETKAAVAMYNSLALAGRRVGALIHSTC